MSFLSEPACRQFSLGEKIVIDIPGNVFKSAIAIGNADNDPLGDNELVIGTLDGALYIVKGNQRLWGDVGLGTIIVVVVGDVLNEGKNFITVATAEGRCYVFQAEQSQPLKRIALFKIPPNVNSLIVTDVDSDGQQELVLGTTDHTLIVFNSIKTNSTASTTTPSLSSSPPISQPISPQPINAFPSPPLSPSSITNALSPPIPQQISTTTTTTTNQLNQTTIATTATPRLSTSTSLPASSSSASIKLRSVGEFSPEWMLKSKKEWVLEGQVESLCLLPSTGNGLNILLVGLLCEADTPAQAQYITITGSSVERHTIAEGTDYVPLSPPINSVPSTSTNTPNSQQQRRNLHRKTQVVSFGDHDGTYVVSSFHGDVALKPGKWMRCFEDIPVLKVASAKNNDGQPVIIVCSWNGGTHVLDSNGHASRFAFGQSVRAFVAGTFSAETGKPGLCFVYVTFHDEIVVYPNIVLGPAHVPTLLESLPRELNNNEFNGILKLLNCNANNNEEKMELIKTCLKCIGFASSDQYNRYRLKLQSQIEMITRKREEGLNNNAIPPPIAFSPQINPPILSSQEAPFMPMP